MDNRDGPGVGDGSITGVSAPARTRPRIGSLELFCSVLVVAVVVRGPIADLAARSTQLQIAATVFLAVCVQALPFLVLGVALSGAIAAYLPPSALRRLLPRRGGAAVGVAGLAGAALPGCECASVPVARRLMWAGVPTSAALAFLLSAPAINPVVLVATAVAFPGVPEMVLARFGGSLVTAVVMGLLWSRFGRPEWLLHGLVPGAGDSDEQPPGASRWEVFTETARHDLLQAGGFLVFGGVMTAALHVLVPSGVYGHLAGHLLLAVAVMAVLAVVLSLCSEADAFVVASLSTVPLLPRLVFLVVGPAVDLKLVAMQAGTFGRAFAVRFAPLTLGVAVLSACGVWALVLVLTR